MTDASDTSDWDITGFLSSYRPPERTVAITVRGDLIGELSQLEEELDRLRQAQDDGSSTIDDGAVIATAQKIMQLRDEVRRSSRDFRVVSVGDRAWSDLIAAHPPTDEQKKDGMPWNVDTFYPEMLAAVVAQPKLTASEAEKLIDVLAASQVRRLVDAALYINGGSDDVPKSNAPFVLRRASEGKPTTASPEESLDPSFLEGL